MNGGTLGGSGRIETPLMFYYVMAVPTEYWTLAKQQNSRIKAADMRFLWAVTSYRERDRIRNQ
jgi:hypothetical protein